MSTKVTKERLIEDHQRIRAACDEFVEAVSSLRPIASERLEELRWNLARESMQHLGLDERYVQVPLEQHDDPAIRAVALRLREHANGFQHDYCTHVAKWTGGAIAAQWRTYGCSVRKLVEQLHERLDLEERELYPLIKHIGSSEPSLPKRNWAADVWALRSSIQSK